MSYFWAIEQQSFNKLFAEETPTEAKNTFDSPEAQTNTDRWAQTGYAAENLRIKDSVAQIEVQGVLLPSASMKEEFEAFFLGKTYSTYAGIVAQIRAASQNPAVEAIELIVDSPGGHVGGVESAVRAIRECDKPVHARVVGTAASAAYWIASQADTITAEYETSSFGSIGILAELTDKSEQESRKGIRTYSLSSTDAPKKNLEPHSEEYKDELVSQLNDLHGVFASAVAEGRSNATGRKITVDQVNTTFGRGGMLIASKALDVGMIDAVVKKPAKEKTMTEQEQAQMRAEAVAEGERQERARVASLLPWMSTDSERITKAIADGESLSPSMIAELSQAAAKAAATPAVPAAAAEPDTAAAAAAAENDNPPVVTPEEPTKVAAEQETEKLADYSARMAKQLNIKEG